MNTDNKILNQTNPVYNTAKMTLSILGSAGVPEAVSFAERLGFTDIRKTFDVNTENQSELPQAVMQETRYEFLNRVIRESNCKNIVDVACGFSPRGYVMAKEGYNYLGIDLEASVEALNSLADSYKDEDIKGSFRYKACDLTNADLLEKCLDDIDGEILVVCEGLLMYFPPFETKSFCESIKRVLTKHGGRFVTGDFIFSDLYVGVHIGLLGQEEGMKALMAMANTTKQKSDTNFLESLVESNGSPKAVKLFEDMGFMIDKIPFYTTSEKCHVFEKIDPENIQKLQGVLSRYMAWSVSVNAEDTSDTKGLEAVEYKSSYSVGNDTLRLVLEGRVDSITSSDLMKVYSEAKSNNGYSKIEIDMSKLQYISSAGLRVLMIMKKDLDGGDVRCVNVRPEIMEIFKTTGFDNILNI